MTDAVAQVVGIVLAKVIAEIFVGAVVGAVTSPRHVKRTSTTGQRKTRRRAAQPPPSSVNSTSHHAEDVLPKYLFHSVEKGDNILGLAKIYQVPVEQIVMANNLRDTDIAHLKILLIPVYSLPKMGTEGAPVESSRQESTDVSSKVD